MEITIKRETLKYALHILNIQAGYIQADENHSKIRREKQLSYYQGMHAMLNLLVQQGFADKTFVLWTDSNYMHTIKRRSDI